MNGSIHMDCHLRIAIADDTDEHRELLAKMLAQMGHEVVCAACDGRDLVQQCQDAEPDLVITDAKMPSLDGIEAIRSICDKRFVPAVLVSAYHNNELMERASDESAILSYLVKPVKRADLETTIHLVLRLSEHIESLRQSSEQAQQALDDRKVIERAKGILMEWTGMKEPDAHRRLQKLARDKNRKLADVARMILSLVEQDKVPAEHEPSAPGSEE